MCCTFSSRSIHLGHCQDKTLEQGNLSPPQSCSLQQCIAVPTEVLPQRRARGRCVALPATG